MFHFDAPAAERFFRTQAECPHAEAAVFIFHFPTKGGLAHLSIQPFNDCAVLWLGAITTTEPPFTLHLDCARAEVSVLEDEEDPDKTEDSFTLQTRGSLGSSDWVGIFRAEQFFVIRSVMRGPGA